MRLVHIAASLALTLLGMIASMAGSTAFGIATPTPPNPLDLAAMTLRPSDLDEPGWVHEGAFIQPLAAQARGHADYLGSGTTAEEVTTVLADAGWERQYVSILSRASQGGPADRVRSYVTRYASPEGAAAGFEYLEDERSVAAATDISLARQHGEVSELTEEKGVTGDDGRALRSLDLTFRVGALVAGVTVIDVDAGERSRSDLNLVDRLASLIEERIAASVDAPAGIGAHAVRLSSDSHELVTFDDAYYRIAAEEVPLVGESAQGSRLRTTTYAGARDVYQLWQGIDTGGDAGALYGATLLRFEDESAAESWVVGLESILAENPFYGDLRFVAGAAGVELGDDAVALSYVANGGGGSAPRSILVAVRVGAAVARVHLVPQGALPSIPLEPTVELARHQVTCLREHVCPGAVDVPPTLTALFLSVRPTQASPEASPVA